MFKSSLASDNSNEPASNNGKTETPVLFIVGDKTNGTDGNGDDGGKLPTKFTNAFQRRQSDKVIDIVSQ